MMKALYMDRTRFGKIGITLAAAALLAGTAARGVLAETYPASFPKTIDRTAAPGSGSLKGSVTFTMGVPAKLPDTLAKTGTLGTTDQIKNATLPAEFDGSGDTALVNVSFDSSKFAAPGYYYFTLTENDTGISGLRKAEPAYYLRARMVNTDPQDPNGELELEKIDLLDEEGNNKVAEIVNTYTTHELEVQKKLAGDFANANDVFTFTVDIIDPDADTASQQEGHMTSVTYRTGSVSDPQQVSENKTEVLENGRAQIQVELKGGEKLEIEGLPESSLYTITESGDAAQSYTTTWAGIDAAGPNTKTSGEQILGDADQTVIVTNTRTAPPVTGLLMDAAPYGAMLAAAGAGGFLLLRKRRDD